MSFDNVLAIDATTAVVSVGLFHQQQICYRENDNKLAGRALLPMVDAVCREAKIAKTDITAIACNIGPGKFVGLRLGFAVAAGIAIGLGIPIISMSGLVARCWQAWQQYQNYHSIYTVEDARQGQLYIYHSLSMQQTISDMQSIATTTNAFAAQLKLQATLPITATQPTLALGEILADSSVIDHSNIGATLQLVSSFDTPLCCALLQAAQGAMLTRLHPSQIRLMYKRNNVAQPQQLMQR